MAVMFCDLRGSTELSARMDPEDLRDVLRGYHAAAASVVERFGGFIARYMGDGLLVYFGYPTAHEDDADRALLAGLEIVETARALPPLPGGGVPEVRVGIDFGLAVIAEMGGGNRVEPNDVVGETANTAARIQAFAEPSTVVISGSAAALLRHPHNLTPLGSVELKGLNRPVELFRAKASRTANEPPTAPRGPLIGRDAEFRILEAAWHRALAGEGGAVLVTGEAGLGKTRLASELRRRARDGGRTVIQLRASPFHQNTAFHPVVGHLTMLLGLEPEMGSQERLSRVNTSLTELGLDAPSLEQPLSVLLNIGDVDRARARTLSGVQLGEAISDALTAWLRAVVRRTPTLLIVEDLHWLDPSTLELILRITSGAAREHLLVLLTSRPGALTAMDGIARIELEPLRTGQTLELVAELAQGSSLTQDELRELVGRSDGVPLFAEELVSTAIEAGAGGTTPTRRAPRDATVPPALFSSLMARLDRMGAAKELARVAAVCGREVSVQLLAKAASVSEERAAAGLGQLADAGIFIRLPRPQTYAFKHALIRDVAYESMLRSDRVEFHAKVADTLEESFPSVCDAEPEVLAHHLERAGAPGRAIPYLRRAGSRAAAQSANREAVTHFRRALALLPSTPDSAASELELLNEIGRPLIAVAGYSSDEVEQNFRRAADVARRLANAEQSFHALSGLRRFHQVQGDVRRARAISEELVSLAGRISAPIFQAIAHHALGEAQFLGGQPLEARSELEMARNLLDELAAAGTPATAEPRVTVRSYLGLAYWVLGYPNRAIEVAGEAAELAVQTDLPFARAYALTVMAWLHELRQEPDAALKYATEAHQLSIEHDYPYWGTAAAVYGGWARALLGDPDGFESLVAGIDRLRVLGARTTEPHLLAMLAELTARRSGAAAALEAVDAGLKLVDQSGERVWLPDLYRLRAKFTLQSDVGAPSQAIGDLERSVRTAQQSGARSQQLRTAVDFAALAPQNDTAVAALRDALDAFPERTDSPGLDRARDLLAQLTGSAEKRTR